MVIAARIITIIMNNYVDVDGDVEVVVVVQVNLEGKIPLRKRRLLGDN